MNTHHFLAECLATPWALQPERMAAYAAVLASRYVGGIRAGEDATTHPENRHANPATPQAATATRAGGNRSGGIAVVPVVGLIQQRATMLSLCDGGTSTQAVSQAIRQANADDTISDILLDIDSPGGSVYGVAELAAEIRASAKPVYAVANSLAASAAYWIGSAAKEFYCTTGGNVGSIGVYMAHEDWSRAIEAQLVTVTTISAGQYKTEGHPTAPLTAEAREHLQSLVNDAYRAFTQDVAKGRGVPVDTVRNGMGQGRVLSATQAKAENMVDGVMTFDQVLAQIQRNRRTAASAPTGRSAAEQRTIALRLAAAQ